MCAKEIAGKICEKLKKEGVGGAVGLLEKLLRSEKTEKMRFTKTTLLNAAGKELGKLLSGEEQKFEWLKGIWKNGARDGKLIVISALGYLAKKNYVDVKKFVLSVINDIRDWEICDQMALRVVSVLSLQNKKEMFSLAEKWKKSENKWVRRLAFAMIPPYVRKSPADFAICLELLSGTENEKDRDVKKAIGWALREITKKNPEAVFEFLSNWAKLKNKNANTIIKDGMKKLPEQYRAKLNSEMGG